MKLTFLGTRGYIEPKSRRHRMHSSLKVSYYGQDVMIDCGEDWLGIFQDLKPRAIVISHAHPDHSYGLKNGADVPVYATESAWDGMQDYDIPDRNTIELRKPVEVEGITFEAFPVKHSTRAPAVGYKITAREKSIFYIPDVVYIEDRAEALKNIQLYIGDGATLRESFVRKQGDELIGHTPVRTQLTWCKKEGVPKAIFTHCGSEIVENDERKLGAEVRKMASERGVEVQIAYDGMELVLR